jgi:hypothetical protein
MKKLKLTLLSVFALVGIAMSVPAYVSAAPPPPPVEPTQSIQDGLNSVDSSNPATRRPLSERIREVVNVILFVLGAIAVIMIIIGGIRYVVSAGDSGAITGAKNTILYAVIGLVVALLAFAIVNFVVNSLK